jgi:hypothetical protein
VSSRAPTVRDARAVPGFADVGTGTVLMNGLPARGPDAPHEGDEVSPFPPLGGG